MSDRRLLLDGPDLQDLLRRAERLGGRVVRAERLRRGLLGRQWYELTVAVPDTPGRPEPVRPAPAVPHAPPAGRPAGIADLLAAAEAAERMESAAGRAGQAARAEATKRERGR